MPFSATDVLTGLVIPAVVAAAVFVALDRSRWLHALAPAAAGWSLALGFAAGYASAQLGPLRPTDHWHWLPLVMLLAAIPGLVPPVNTTTKALRLVLIGLLAGGS